MLVLIELFFFFVQSFTNGRNELIVETMNSQK